MNHLEPGAFSTKQKIKMWSNLLKSAPLSSDKRLDIKQTHYNDAPVPKDLIKEGAWEIRERVPVSGKNFTPYRLPTVDRTTKYKEVGGKARYLVEKNVIAETEMSKVYKGYDRRLKREVAVKEIMEYLFEYEAYRDGVELEAKTIAKLMENSHPGIPIVYDFIKSQMPDGSDKSLMIMELIEGETLRSRLNDITKPPLTNFEIVDIITQTADTVDFMNHKGLTHGDIKPKNIMLKEPHLKIIDYGLSSWVKGVHGITDGFSSPELVNRKIKDARSDEFALAATAHDILFGDTPAEGKIVTERQFMSKDFKYEISRDDIKKLVKIFNKALSENPNQRYQTSTKFAQEFCKIIKNVKLKNKAS